MLKRRTRITARVFGLLLLLSVLGAAGTQTKTTTERTMLIVCSVVPCVMWFTLLLRQSWAWWGLLVFYGFGLLGMVSYASVLSSGSDRLFNICALGAVTLATIVWPVVILLTDRPKGWPRPVSPDSDIRSDDTAEGERSPECES